MKGCVWTLRLHIHTSGGESWYIVLDKYLGLNMKEVGGLFDPLAYPNSISPGSADPGLHYIYISKRKKGHLLAWWRVIYPITMVSRFICIWRYMQVRAIKCKLNINTGVTKSLYFSSECNKIIILKIVVDRSLIYLLH